MADPGEFPSSVEHILKEASKEIINNQDGYCFTVDNSDTSNENEPYSSVYKPNELSEFINFDMLCEEGETIEPFQQFTKNNNCQNLTGDNKVKKILIDPGIGQVVPEDSIVMVHYIGYVENLHEPFDVSYLQGKRPKRFTLGEGELIPGLEIGIKTMKTGENARFLIHPDLAFRGLGCPPRIPPNAHVLFDVHLVKYFSADTYLTFNDDRHDPDRFRKVLDETNKLRIEGNTQFKLKNFKKSTFKYERGLELLYMVGCNNQKEEIDMMKTLNKLYANLSICYLKQCAFNKVCRMGIEAMKYSGKFSQNNAKIYFNWGKALRLLKNFSEAKIKLNKSLKLEPHNETIHNELLKLEKDRMFNVNVESFTFNDSENENQRLPPEFWEVFDTRLAEFVDSEDDVLTVTLNKNLDDIEVTKRKASSFDLKVEIMTNNDVETDCIAIRKFDQ